MKEIDNIHRGHRVRLINTVDKCGLDGLSDIQVLEFFLFFVFPRVDVNPLAHRLLDKYKSISGVLEASVDDLKTVKGMGDVSAKKLHSFPRMFDMYMLDKSTRPLKKSSKSDIFDTIEGILRFKNTENLLLIAMNQRGEYLGERIFQKGSYDRIVIEQKDIALFVMNYHASGVVIAHNHPNGSIMPSRNDLISHEELMRRFEFGGVELIDNLIVGYDGIYSLKDKEVKRSFFHDKKEYDDALKQIQSQNIEILQS